MESIETIARIIEKIPIYKDKGYGLESHYLRLRAVYYDDKHSTHIGYVDYIYPQGTDKKRIINPKKLYDLLFKAFTIKDNKIMNLPSWDILYLEENTLSDSFQLDHKNYYEPYLKEFEKGMARNEFLHDLAFQFEMFEKIKNKKRKI